MKTITALLRAGPLMVGEVRGAKSETARRFDKSDKNAAPQEFGVFKVHVELLGEGTPVMLTVFLDVGTKPEEYAQRVSLKRGDIIALAVSKLEIKNGVRRAVCRPDGLVVLDKGEADLLRV